MGGAGRLTMLCEHVVGNIPDNRDIIFAIERIIDFSRSIGIHCTSPEFLIDKKKFLPDLS